MNISNVSFGQLKIADNYTKDILLSKMKNTVQREAIEKSFNSINEWSGKDNNVYFRITRDGYSGGYTYRLYMAPGNISDDVLSSTEVPSNASSGFFATALEFLNNYGKKDYESRINSASSEKENEAFLNQFI